MKPHPHTTEQVRAIVEEFRTKFADENIWKDESEETAFVPIGNMEDWLTTKLTTAITAAEERERERIASIPIIKEFVESTKIWYDDLAPAFKRGKCIMCGRRIEKQKELSDALETLTLPPTSNQT